MDWRVNYMIMGYAMLIGGAILIAIGIISFVVFLARSKKDREAMIKRIKNDFK